MGSMVIHQAYQEIHDFKNFSANGQLRKLLNQYNLFYPPKIQIQFSQGIIYDQQNRFAH